jgi:hypothetical protein
MNEDFATRAWADNYGRFGRDIATAVRTIKDAMEVLHAKQFDAPWKQPSPRTDCSTC